MDARDAKHRQDRPIVLRKQRSAHLERYPSGQRGRRARFRSEARWWTVRAVKSPPWPVDDGIGTRPLPRRQQTGHEQPVRMIGNRQDARRGIRRRRKEAVSEHQSGERRRPGESHPRWMHRQPIREPDGEHVGLTNESSMDNRTRAPKHFADARPSTSPDHAGQTGRQEQGCGQEPGRWSSPSR
jgi:hypothetical protein